MGSKEKHILEEAEEEYPDGSWSPDRSTSRRTLKRLVEKNWLRRVDIGEFVITEDGRRELEERKEDFEDQKGLGDFSG